MTEIHRYVGYVVVGIFTIGWLFGLGLWVSRREAGDWFWRWLVAAQTVAIAQALIGVVLLALCAVATGPVWGAALLRGREHRIAHAEAEEELSADDDEATDTDE